MEFGGIEEEKAGRGGVESKRRGQVYTSNLLEVNEEGVRFRSYRDGKHISLTPESSVQAQKSFGADIIIPLDELLPSGADRHSTSKMLILMSYTSMRATVPMLSPCLRFNPLPGQGLRSLWL